MFKKMNKQCSRAKASLLRHSCMERWSTKRAQCVHEAHKDAFTTKQIDYTKWKTFHLTNTSALHSYAIRWNVELLALKSPYSTIFLYFIVSPEVHLKVCMRLCTKTSPNYVYMDIFQPFFFILLWVWVQYRCKWAVFWLIMYWVFFKKSPRLKYSTSLSVSDAVLGWIDEYMQMYVLRTIQKQCTPKWTIFIAWFPNMDQEGNSIFWNVYNIYTPHTHFKIPSYIQSYMIMTL